MRRSTKYVALDVHQATTVASVREERGRVIARSVVPTEEAALLEFFRGLRGSIHVAMEEGTQAQWLHELLAPRVDRVVICDRRGQARRGTKGDQVDADQLSEELWRGGLRAVYHGSGRRAVLKELTRTYQNLVEDSSRVMLRLKALFRARGIRAPGQRVYQPLGPAARGRSAIPGRSPLCRARRAAGAAAEGEDGDGRRGTARPSVGVIADDCLLRAGARGAAGGHDADAVAVSDQAESVGLRRPGGGEPVQRGL